MNIYDKGNALSFEQKEAVLVGFWISKARELENLGPWKLMENFLSFFLSFLVLCHFSKCVVCFVFKHFCVAEFRICDIWLIVVEMECFAENLRKVKVASRYRTFSNSCHLFIKIILTFNIELRCWLIVINEVKCYHCYFEVWICLCGYVCSSGIDLLPINLVLSPAIFISIITSIIFWCPRSPKRC